MKYSELDLGKIIEQKVKDETKWGKTLYRGASPRLQARYFLEGERACPLVFSPDLSRQSDMLWL
ncbi:MAG: hypothetical protein AB2L12_08425 [Smithellaceae bacterium]